MSAFLSGVGDSLLATGGSSGASPALWVIRGTIGQVPPYQPLEGVLEQLPSQPARGALGGTVFVQALSTCRGPQQMLPKISREARYRQGIYRLAQWEHTF